MPGFVVLKLLELLGTHVNVSLFAPLFVPVGLTDSSVPFLEADQPDVQVAIGCFDFMSLTVLGDVANQTFQLSGFALLQILQHRGPVIVGCRY